MAAFLFRFRYTLPYRARLSIPTKLTRPPSRLLALDTAWGGFRFKWFSHPTFMTYFGRGQRAEGGREHVRARSFAELHYSSEEKTWMTLRRSTRQHIHTRTQTHMSGMLVSQDMAKNRSGGKLSSHPFAFVVVVGQLAEFERNALPPPSAKTYFCRLIIARELIREEVANESLFFSFARNGRRLGCW